MKKCRTPSLGFFYQCQGMVLVPVQKDFIFPENIGLCSYEKEQAQSNEF